MSVASAPRSYLNDGEHYDACHAHRLDDVGFWTTAAASCRSVLVLGCGTGRIAIPIAAGGADVVGIDSSASMLAQAERKTRAGASAVRYVLGDMRAFDLGRDDIDLAILGFNTVNLLLTLEDALACLRCARRHLAPTGRLIIDTFLAAPPRLLEEELRHGYVLQDGVGVTIDAKRTYDPAQQIRTLDLTIYTSDGQAPQADRHDVHVYYPAELSLVLMQAGFDVVATYGSYDQRRLDPRSHRLILVATPRA